MKEEYNKLRERIGFKIDQKEENSKEDDNKENEFK